MNRFVDLTRSRFVLAGLRFGRMKIQGSRTEDQQTSGTLEKIKRFNSITQKDIFHMNVQLYKLHTNIKV